MQVPQYMLYEFRNDRLIVGQKIRETVCHSAHHYLPDSSAHTIYAVRKEDERSAGRHGEIADERAVQVGYLYRYVLW